LTSIRGIRVPGSFSERLTGTASRDLFVGAAGGLDKLKVGAISDDGHEGEIVDRVTHPRNVPYLSRLVGGTRGRGLAIPRRQDPAAEQEPGGMSSLGAFASMRFFDWSLDAMRQPAPPG
jgi:hypothetical protein